MMQWECFLLSLNCQIEQDIKRRNELEQQKASCTVRHVRTKVMLDFIAVNNSIVYPISMTWFNGFDYPVKE